MLLYIYLFHWSIASNPKKLYFLNFYIFIVDKTNVQNVEPSQTGFHSAGCECWQNTSDMASFQYLWYGLSLHINGPQIFVVVLWLFCWFKILAHHSGKTIIHVRLFNQQVMSWFCVGIQVYWDTPLLFIACYKCALF